MILAVYTCAVRQARLLPIFRLVNHVLHNSTTPTFTLNDDRREHIDASSTDHDSLPVLGDGV